MKVVVVKKLVTKLNGDEEVDAYIVSVLGTEPTNVQLVVSQLRSF